MHQSKWGLVTFFFKFLDRNLHNIAATQNLYPRDLSSFVQISVRHNQFWNGCQGFRCHFYSDGLTSVPAWMINYIHFKVRDEFTYQFPNFNGATTEFWEWIRNVIPRFTGNEIYHPWWELSSPILVNWAPEAVDTRLFLLSFVSYEAFQDTPSIDRLVSITNESVSSVSASMPH